MSKIIMFNKEAKDKLLAGVSSLSRAVKVTLGPCGRTVLLGKGLKSPHITKDGVSVSKEIFSDDPVENMGITVVKEVAELTVKQAGDGTTSSTILAEAIFREGLTRIYADSKSNVVAIQRGINEAVTAVVAYLKSIAKDVSSKEDIFNIAMVSTNGDMVLSELISNAFTLVGKDGSISIIDSRDDQNSLTSSEGLIIDRGMTNDIFRTDTNKTIAVLENALVLVCERPLEDTVFIDRLMGLTGNNAILIIADVTNDTVAHALAIHKQRNKRKVCVIKPPAFGDQRSGYMDDIAIYTGGTNISPNYATFEEFQFSQLGRAKHITVNADRTVIRDGNGIASIVDDRKQFMANCIADAKSDYIKSRLTDRLNKLNGKCCTIALGAVSETESKEIKDRLDDAICATRAALEEGVVAGGGIALLNATSCLDKLQTTCQKNVGVDIIRAVLKVPFNTILENAGEDTETILESIKSSPGATANTGINLYTNTICDMVEAGIIDPVKVTRVALTNAASVAGSLLTTECVVCDTALLNFNNNNLI